MTMYNAQMCESWKQRIMKEELGVIAMLEQSRANNKGRQGQGGSTRRTARPGTNSSRSAASRPATGSSFNTQSSARSYSQASRSSYGGSSTRRSEDEAALIRSTMARLDRLEAELVEEKDARTATECQLKDLRRQVAEKR
eukprot:TRINITY_DN2422_c0_g1_i1.p1 TRINITY_DN2422_c0_g1~~TRINITY_DN2422_c0_g1_i1.p1  ORF type:complete len:140 (-),score=18.50 TRINITY_DN2422_c0_g1_i1:461-880(-)